MTVWRSSCKVDEDEPESDHEDEVDENTDVMDKNKPEPEHVLFTIVLIQLIREL